MMEKQKTRPLDASVDVDEVAKFSALADEWWDPEGSFQPLHKLNPARLGFIRDRICRRFDRDPFAPRPLAGLRLADIGCGGGLLTEPMARLGAQVTGLDASERNIMVARNHAERMGLDIDYRFSTVEAAAEAGEQYDIVLNMEVVEHVADVDGFLAASCALVAPGGAMFVATLNRTLKSFAFAIVGAEYVLRWLPRGTHDWRKFRRPSEIAAALRRGGLTVESFAGLAFDPLKDTWRIDGENIAVNYLGFAVRP
ncbi:MAG: bifunctional 2-polyprenyl-6-hydroxyphenol methylase/3-demethylubiquinol 3-O-methyltransferase UbiG [Rickettsiales bacterium]